MFGVIPLGSIRGFEVEVYELASSARYAPRPSFHVAKGYEGRAEERCYSITAP